MTLDLAAEPPLVEDACFHAQQVVEKVLKAFLEPIGCHSRRCSNSDTRVRFSGGKGVPSRRE